MPLRTEQDGEFAGSIPAPPTPPHRSKWEANKGLLFIILAQATGSSMDAIVRYLQQGDRGMHPFQVMFARMSTTLVLSSAYMWWTSVPDFPLGKRGVRKWLVARASFGFGGLFCLYCEDP